MRKLSIIIFALITCYGANAQVASGEKFLGGGVSISASNGSTAISILPEFRYAHSDNRLVGLTAGVISTPPTTVFVIGPNYSWLFPIEGNFFWSATGFTNISVGDYSDLTLGVNPGLGYRIHDKWLITLSNPGVSYSTNAELFSLNFSLRGFAVGAYWRLGE